jgi:glycosidase
MNRFTLATLRCVLVAYAIALFTPIASSQTSPKKTPVGGAAASSQVREDQQRRLIPPQWWEKGSAVYGVRLRADDRGSTFPLRDEARLAARLDEIRAMGFSAIQIGAPAEGGTSYGGLDFKNHYAIRPEAGNMDDFRRMVRLAHSKGLAVAISYNLGYSSVDAPFWLKACDDVREGRDSKEARWFVWSNRRDAPSPPSNTFFNPPGRGFWEWSEKARRYFWTRWAGVDDKGNDFRLPQYNWGTPEFQEEVERIVRFWMDTGIDGIMMDAVNWYSNIDWNTMRRRMTDVMASYGNVYMQPEGGGGFREDPVPWITDGGWNCVQDYGLGTWWIAGSHVIQKAFQTGDPRPIEAALRAYHDRVIAAGGVLYTQVPSLVDPVEPNRTEAPHLAAASMTTLGYLLARPRGGGGAAEPDPEVQWLLRTKRDHPALHQLSQRRQVPTNADDSFYAFLRTAADGSERILVVLNFRRGFQTIDVDLSGVATSGLVEMKTGEEIPPQDTLRVRVYSYGYRLYQVKPLASTGFSKKGAQ